MVWLLKKIFVLFEISFSGCGELGPKDPDWWVVAERNLDFNYKNKNCQGSKLSTKEK